jgi:hypothetical protein
MFTDEEKNNVGADSGTDERSGTADQGGVEGADAVHLNVTDGDDHGDEASPELGALI